MVTIRPLSPRPDHDVIVAGAGPAGAATAAHLATAGHDVLLVDQRRFPRDKVCGDFVGPAAVVELERLGVAARSEYAATNQIRRAAVHIDGRRLTEQELPQVGGLPPTGRVVPRNTLDAWIVEAALAAGARLRRGRVTGFTAGEEHVEVRMTARRKTHTITARVLVGADGSTSTVAKALRGTPTPPRDRIIAVRAYYHDVAGPDDRADLYFSAHSFPGYTWVFPAGGGRANAGVGMVLDTLPGNREHLRDLFLDLIDRDVALRGRLRHARLDGRIVGWPLTTFNPRLPLVADRVLLVGDAAGLINPLNGEGIQYALQSGRWAAETVTEGLADGDLTGRGLAPYARRVHTEVRYDMALAGLLVALIRNRDLNPVWMGTLRAIVGRVERDPTYATLAGGILAGLVPASRALSPKMLGGTIAGAASNLRLPADLPAFGMAVARTGFTLAYDTATDPAAVKHWLREVASGTTELASEVTLGLARSVIRR